jgi:hypothetical protein
MPSPSSRHLRIGGCSGLVDYIIGSVATRNFVVVNLYYSVHYPFLFPFVFNKHSAQGIPSVQTYFIAVADLAFANILYKMKRKKLKEGKE